MEDKSFFCVWNDSLKESKEEFSKKFIEITSNDDKEGLYTFFFSRFSIDEHKLATDVLYINIYKETVLFFPHPFKTEITYSKKNELQKKLERIFNLKNLRA